MALDKQFYIYSIDTSAFYTDEEKLLHDEMFTRKLKINEIKVKAEEDGYTDVDVEEMVKELNKEIKEFKKELKELIPQFTGMRELRADHLKESNEVSIFDSSLTRALGLIKDETTQKLFVVRAYYYGILESLINNGFTHEEEIYDFFTSSAGQIRTKRNQFINQNAWDIVKDAMTCGLTIERINECGGINVNKYLAYLALCCTASDQWLGFDIDRAIVVDDFETMVVADVDYVNDMDYSITRQTMEVPIPHMDGCGISLDYTGMFRMPWFKGLVVQYDYIEQIREYREQGIECGKVKDIYGKEYDLIEDDIHHIFTKSQFKMYKYYDSWDDYKTKFKKYGCEAAKCNEEEEEIDDTNFSYQMLQTLFDMTEQEMVEILRPTNENIEKLGTDFPTVRKILGFENDGTRKKPMQQALQIYPELIHDNYNKQMIKDKKANIISEAKSGRFEVEGKYTFVCPDLYAFCEWLLLGEENPKGLLQDGEIACTLYSPNEELDCLRSPHLFCEHGIRLNKSDERIAKYFTTKCVYVSVHDVISKILQFDCDGDKLQLNRNKTIINCAKRTIKKFDIVPLYYNMKKAPAHTIGKKQMYDGMISAYKGGNIGTYSNAISKICNTGQPITDVEIKIIKWLCMENNIVIDSAKTLEFVNRPEWVNDIIKPYTSKKLPYFFRFAKDKEDTQTEDINNSNVNIISKLIRDRRLVFKMKEVGKFDYRMLLSNTKFKWTNQEIVDVWDSEAKRVSWESRRIMDNKELTKAQKNRKIYRLKIGLRQIMFCLDYKESEIIDTVIQYLYRDKSSRNMAILWDAFGEYIVANLKGNVDSGNTIVCERCGCRIEKTTSNNTFCKDCAKIVKKKQVAEAVKRHRNKQM